MKDQGDCDPHKDDGDTLPPRSLFGTREGSSRRQRVTPRGRSQRLTCVKTTGWGGTHGPEQPWPRRTA